MKAKKFNKYIVMLMFLFLTISGIAGCGEKEEDYRQIQVYKIDGTATVARQGSSMDAYENMQLQSGDVIETIAESYLQLKLDEDKYILIEPESKISLQATGNSVDSKTSIHLEKGAIVNQLDNPLSDNSSYEITTPNSTMAVRGTTFRVEITVDENGESYAKVAVYGGKVECNLVFPDGTIAEPLLVEKGTEVLIWGDDTQTEYVGSGQISYEEMKTVVMDFLKEIIDKGEELSITKEEIVEIMQAIESLENEEETDEEEAMLGEDIPESVDAEENTDETDNNESPEITSVNERKKEEEKDKQKETQQKPSNPTGGNTGITGGNTAGSSSSGGNTSGGSSSGGNTGGDTTEPEPDPTLTRNITVNFVVKYSEEKSQVFATKTKEEVSVKETGIDIQKPLLIPSVDGTKGYWVNQETEVWGQLDAEPYFGESDQINQKIDAGTEDLTITLYWWAGLPE